MKTIIRHETQEDFFARMTSLAQNLDRREPVEACDSISFEDLDEMKAFQADQEKKDRKASFTVILGGGGKTKAKAKGLHIGVESYRRFTKGRWITASITFEREAEQIVKNYTAMVRRCDGKFISVTTDRVENEVTPVYLRDK